MTYALIIYQGTAPTPRTTDRWNALSPEEQQGLFAEYRALNALPGVSTGLVLQPAKNLVATVQLNGEASEVQYKAYDAADREVDSILLVNTDDMDHAVEIAALVPAARLGGAVEIRLMATPAGVK